MRKLESVLMMIVISLSFIMIVPQKADAGTPPTITKYGLFVGEDNDHYGDVGEWIYMWLTYTDIDNDSVAAGYPFAVKLSYNWPKMVMSENDTFDTNKADGKAYFCTYIYFPVIGSTIFMFSVKSVGEVNVVSKADSNTAANCVLPSVSLPFGVYPANNDAGPKVFVFNYTSKWQYTPHYVDVWIDDIVYNMTPNNTMDTDYRDGFLYHFDINLTAGLHNYSFHWAEQGGWWGDRSSGYLWLLLENPPDYNRFYVAITLLILIFGTCFIIFRPFKPRNN